MILNCPLLSLYLYCYCMTFYFSVSRAQAVVYVTRSMHKAENEAVVNRCVEFINMVQQKKMPWRVSPPVLPLSQRDIESENHLSGKYLIFQADYTSSGCFLAVITREVNTLRFVTF